MIYQVENIIQDVQVALSNNRQDIPLVNDGDLDTLEVLDTIQSKIEEAARTVTAIAPAYMLERGHSLDESAIYWNEDCSGTILLPNDFLRLIVFKMSDWDKAVYTPITPEDERYRLQHSGYKGLRGTPSRPVCALGMNANGRTLEFFSCKTTDAVIEDGVYSPIPRIDDIGGIDISEDIYTAVIYQIAYSVAATFGDANGMKIFGEKVKEVLV